MFEPTLHNVNDLFRRHGVREEIVRIEKLSGTTAGLVLKLESRQENAYVLKFDHPDSVRPVRRLLEAYASSPLLPQVLLTAEDDSYFAYAFMEGTTHFNRGAKKDWMKALTVGLLNRYEPCEDADYWGRTEYPRASWREFNEIGIEEARINLGNVLTEDDYRYVKQTADKLFDSEAEQGAKYGLHGDTGVHNFVYRDSALIGVIDPSPMAGPILYDFLYAFCSSPDDLNIETLLAALDDLEHVQIRRPRLIEETLIQLYCRTGLSVKHHPHDLPGYLEAWSYWTALCRRQEEDDHAKSADAKSPY
ncbi:phosphotransferase [Saccharibacillus alkalitolerans]|uniref:Aminoglycoside phosphotransferase domain-containing protein n=1 Tax=Saccharibacillus alkalitolerans TaxID=2705290 RepID=A0ABX0FAV6_9BACL|nr:phosphotransferase [Saccharibacillus alkalitolerans]NGZ76683.1 hypothetical protein [Saccharibacillus alkalitolerans]